MNSTLECDLDRTTAHLPVNGLAVETVLVSGNPLGCALRKLACDGEPYTVEFIKLGPFTVHALGAADTTGKNQENIINPSQM